MQQEPVTIEQEEDDKVQTKQVTPVTTRQIVTQKPARPPAEKKTAAQIVAQSKLLQKVMEEVMRPEVHYGVISGTDKPTLYKAGSEVLLSTFRIAVYPEVTDLSDEDCVKYRVLAHGVHQVTGVTLGIGVGECSTNEDKYKWRRAVCDEEYDDTDDDRRKIKYKKGYYDNSPVERIKMVRQEPADLANTVLKMAKKRAQIDLTLTATGASDIFVQDLDDAGNLVQREQPMQQKARTTSTGGSGKKATGKQVKFLEKKLADSSKDLEDLKEHFSVEGIADLTMDQVNPVLEWLK